MNCSSVRISIFLEKLSRHLFRRIKPFEKWYNLYIMNGLSNNELIFTPSLFKSLQTRYLKITRHEKFINFLNIAMKTFGCFCMYTRNSNSLIRRNVVNKCSKKRGSWSFDSFDVSDTDPMRHGYKTLTTSWFFYYLAIR